jgi:UDP-glucose 4-epimerase
MTLSFVADPLTRSPLMKCLILGGAGFLGSHLADRLLEKGHAVRLFDRFEAAKTNIEHLLPHIELVQGDFANHALATQITKNIDIVYHLISTTAPKVSNDDMLFDVSTNLLPTLQLLDACTQNGVKKVVFFSSGGTIYGIPREIPIPESHPTEPICSYGIQKRALEK